MRQHYRHTKIIATLGPATESARRLSELIASGVDVFRLNMAHGTRAWVADVVARIRCISADVGRHVAIMMDVKGPEIRTGPVESPIALAPDDEIELYATEPRTTGLSVGVNYPGLPADVSLGATLLVDSGLLRFEVVEKGEDFVRCRVLVGGELGSRRHVNLPGVSVNLPSLTDKDEGDVRAGVEAGVDFFALSFVRRARDVTVLQRLLQSLESPARVVAKIEDQSGVRNLEEIVAAADAVMVARGDLGIEIDYHTLALVQTRMVEVCLRLGKPVIIATHLLESMISSPMPTRAEISDVSTAVRERADAVMLSGETTTGAYPLECVDVMKKIIGSIEPAESRGMNEALELKTPKAKMLRASASLAQKLGSSGVVVFTRSGFLAYKLAALRASNVPVFAFTDDSALFRRLLLPWGVEPFLMPFDDDPEVTVRDALAYLQRRGWCHPGDWLVVVTNALAHGQVIDSMQLRRVG